MIGVPPCAVQLRLRVRLGAIERGAVLAVVSIIGRRAERADSPEPSPRPPPETPALLG